MPPAKRDDWKTIPLPDVCRPVLLDRIFSAAEFTTLIVGRVPKMMEHKWFIFYEEPWLYFHRSWTGFCLYKVRLEPLGDETRIVEAWANPGYSHCWRIQPDDGRQRALDPLELAALIDSLAGRPTKEQRRLYREALAKEDPDNSE